MFPHLTFALCILKKNICIKRSVFSLQDGVNIIQGYMSFEEKLSNIPISSIH